MKKLEMMIVLVIITVTMILGIAPVMASEREAEIRQRVPFIEVEWQPLISLSPKLYRAVVGIFPEPCGAIRVVDSHPYRMGGRRVWLSKDDGQTWILEKESGRAKRDIERMLGRERAKVVLAPRGTAGQRFSMWPKETKPLIQTVFREVFEWASLYNKDDPRSFMAIQFARDPNRLERLAFSTSWKAKSARVFVSLSRGEEWIEVSSPQPAMTDGATYVFAIGIKSDKNNVVLYAGLMGGGKNILQYAVLPLSKLQELQELVAKK